MNDKTDQTSSVTPDGNDNQPDKKKTGRRSKKKSAGVKTESDVVKESAATTTGGLKNQWIGILALLAVIVLAGVVFYMERGQQQSLQAFKTDESNQQSLFQEIGEKQNLLATDIKKQSQQLSELAGSQSVLKDSIDVLNKKKPDSNLDWAMMESEYLIIIAMHRLLLERDVATAIAALESADRRLKNIGTPALIPVREQLAKDITALKSVNEVDTTGLVLYLSGLISETENLPLKKQMIFEESAAVESSDSEEQANWKKLPALIWDELKSLVVIKHKGEEGTKFFLPEEEYYLYQNLRLQLESAKLSVLNLDSQNLSASIEIINDWLERHFDTEHASVSNVQDALTKMQSLDLKPALPEVNSSLETLRAFIKEQESRETGS